MLREPTNNKFKLWDIPCVHLSIVLAFTSSISGNQLFFKFHIQKFCLFHLFFYCYDFQYVRFLYLNLCSCLLYSFYFRNRTMRESTLSYFIKLLYLHQVFVECLFHLIYCPPDGDEERR